MLNVQSVARFWSLNPYGGGSLGGLCRKSVPGAFSVKYIPELKAPQVNALCTRYEYDRRLRDQTEANLVFIPPH